MPRPGIELESQRPPLPRKARCRNHYSNRNIPNSPAQGDLLLFLAALHGSTVSFLLIAGIFSSYFTIWQCAFSYSLTCSVTVAVSFFWFEFTFSLHPLRRGVTIRVEPVSQCSSTPRVAQLHTRLMPRGTDFSNFDVVEN